MVGLFGLDRRRDASAAAAGREPSPSFMPRTALHSNASPELPSWTQSSGEKEGAAWMVDFSEHSFTLFNCPAAFHSSALNSVGQCKGQRIRVQPVL